MQKHGQQGYFLIIFALLLTAVDLLNMFRRVFLFLRTSPKFHLKTFWNSAILGKEEEIEAFGEAEYTGLVSEEPEETELISPISPPPHKHVHYDNAEENETAQWANNVRRHHREYSHSVASEATLFGRSHSDDNLHDSNSDRHPRAKVPLVRRLSAGIFATLERTLVFGGLAQILTGIIVYTGSSGYPSWF